MSGPRPLSCRGTTLLSERGVSPPCGDEYKLFVQTRRFRTVEGQPANEQDARHGIGGLREAGAGEIVMNKALRDKTREQTLDNALLKMHLHDFFRHLAWILEYDGPDGRGASPFPKLLVAFAGNTQAVHRFSPGRISADSLIECGQRELRRVIPIASRTQRLCPHYLKGTRQRGAEMRFGKLNGLP